jgi:lysophospholipase L1-like esterase
VAPKTSLVVVALSTFGIAVLAFSISGVFQAPSRDPIVASPFDTPPDTARIVTFGTSLTARYDWPEILTDRLAVCLDRSADVTIMAGAGQTSDWGLAQIGQVIAARPNVVIIEFTVNDADIRQGVSPAQSQANHVRIIDALKAARPDIRILLIGTNPVFGLRGMLRIRMQAYLDSYVALAEADPQVGLLDLASPWRDHIDRNGQRASLPDGLHPDMASARLVIIPPVSAAVAALWGQVCPPPMS